MIAGERQKGEHYIAKRSCSIYEINMLRCIFCGLCEEACPKEAIYLDGPIVPADYLRKDLFTVRITVEDQLGHRLNNE